MYNYPNPMNVAIDTFHRKHSFVINKDFEYQMDDSCLFKSANIERIDQNNRNFEYVQYVREKVSNSELIKDIFHGCKTRKARSRKAFITQIEDAPASYNINNPLGL